MKANSPRKRIGIWLRVSTEDQVLGESPQHHEERARAYALAKDWTVVEVYRLDAVSGKSVRDHPEARRMLADIRRGHITGLVFSKLARLARNTRELLEFSEDFQACGADLISLQESIDTSTAAGRLFYTIIGAVGQWEREETSERVAASVPVRARLGKTTGGSGSFGYRWVEGRLVPDPEEAPVRRLIYELYREHKRKRTVAGILNDRGYRMRGGGLFTATTVGRLLADTTAKGIRTANYSRSRGIGKGWDHKPEAEWVTFPVEAIVDEDLWRECNAIVEETGTKYATHRGRKPTYLFAGVVRCGTCGGDQKLYRSAASPKYRCYRCAAKIAGDDLEALLVEQLSGFLLSEDRIDEMLEESKREAERRQALAETLRRDRKDAHRKADGLVDLYQQGGLGIDEFKDRNAPLRQRISEIDAELVKIEREAGAALAATSVKREALADGVRLRDEWPSMDLPQKRKIVEGLVERITLTGDEVEFSLNYIPGATIANCDREDRGSWPRRA